MSWLLAFLVHSTLWCGTAWLLLRLRPCLSARVRETMWTTALLASLLTPTAQLLAGTASFWSLPFAEVFGRVDVGGAGGEHAVAASTSSWTGAVIGTWLAIGGALTLLYAWRLDSLRRRLGDREILAAPDHQRTLEQLSARAGLVRVPRLSESDRLGSPIAIGMGATIEVCLPTRALHELDREEFRALLAHEVAHHRRGDTLRLALLQVLQALFFVQPLFRVAVRGIHTAAEEQCDDWAATQVDDRLAVASCLTEVAAWVFRHDCRLPMPGMAQRRSLLRARVDRMVDGTSEPVGRGGGRLCAAAGLLLLSPWLAPQLTTGVEPEHEGAGHTEHRAAEEHEGETRREVGHEGGGPHGRGDHRSGSEHARR